MKNMLDIVDTSIVERLYEIFTDTSLYEKETIDHIWQLWAQSFLQMVENQEVEEQNLQDQMQMVEEDKDIEMLPKQKRKKKKKKKTYI
ncbi:hypothetical protein RYX36_032400 [Vicia faba]